MTIKMMRLPETVAAYGKPKSSLYRDVKNGLLTPPVDIGLRASAWPDNEVQAVIRARIAGQNDEQIRALVRQLIAARTVGKA